MHLPVVSISRSPPQMPEFSSNFASYFVHATRFLVSSSFGSFEVVVWSILGGKGVEEFCSWCDHFLNRPGPLPCSSKSNVSVKVNRYMPLLLVGARGLCMPLAHRPRSL